MTNPTDPNNQTRPPAGWYDDGTGQQRYWTGAQWADAPAQAPVTPTDYQAGAAASAPGAPAAPAAAAAASAPGAPVYGSGAPGTATAPKKQKNTLGLVALIVAVVGFIFACIPGALIIGWVLLPIAFILAIVALVLKGKSKTFALTET